MSQLSFCGETSGIRQKVLKRKRESSDEDEDVENMPPKKRATSRSPAGEEIEINLMSSSPLQPLSEEEVGYFTSAENNDFPDVEKSCLDDYTYSENSHSSFSITDIQGGILSPLENINVPIGDSTPHSSRRPNSSRPDFKESRQTCPLPSLAWADPCEVWNRMCASDVESAARRNPRMMDRHGCLQIRMRAILIDWMNEVSEVYKLQRETFHLSIDYVDRYLSNTEGLPKGRLQLIGITCLFIASKVEEVYPPKITEFAYVTDGACSPEEILKEEIVILQGLGWNSTTITMNAWLKMYMQLCSEHENATNKTQIDNGESRQFNTLRPYTFIFPQYSSLEFTIIAQVIDLAALHVGVNVFPYSLVAASAVSHVNGIEMALKVSGYTWEELEPCHLWLTHFMEVLEEEGLIGMNRPLPNVDMNVDCRAGSGGLHIICPNITLDESHRIQMHNISLEMFDKVELKLSKVPPSEKPVVDKDSVAFTPPQSRHKGSLMNLDKIISATALPCNVPELPNLAEAI